MGGTAGTTLGNGYNIHNDNSLQRLQRLQGCISPKQEYALISYVIFMASIREGVQRAFVRIDYNRMVNENSVHALEKNVTISGIENNCVSLQNQCLTACYRQRCAELQQENTATQLTEPLKQVTKYVRKKNNSLVVLPDHDVVCHRRDYTQHCLCHRHSETGGSESHHYRSRKPYDRRQRKNAPCRASA